MEMCHSKCKKTNNLHSISHKSWEKYMSTVNRIEIHISLCGSIVMWCIAGLCCTLRTPYNAGWCHRTTGVINTNLRFEVTKKCLW